MHKFLRAIGFSRVTGCKTEELLLKDVLSGYDSKRTVEDLDKNLFVEISKEYGLNFGVTVCGTYDEDNLFRMGYYFPYLKGQMVTTYDQASIERRIANQAYSAACDDSRIGATVIFYLQNAADYIQNSQSDKIGNRDLPISLAALAEYGSILLPVAKEVKAPVESAADIQSRNQLYEAAQNGDQDAIEDLTLKDMDTYNRLSKRVQKEDIYTIVDTFFMPHGLECDYYSLMGDIAECTAVRNSLTGELLYQMQVICNGISIDVMINAADLLGEPKVGRRFKGVVWLQGRIDF